MHQGKECEAKPGSAQALPANVVGGRESLCDPRELSEPIPARPQNQRRGHTQGGRVEAAQGGRAAPSCPPATPSAGTLPQKDVR